MPTSWISMTCNIHTAACLYNAAWQQFTQAPARLLMALAWLHVGAGEVWRQLPISSRSDSACMIMHVLSLRIWHTLDMTHIWLIKTFTGTRLQDTCCIKLSLIVIPSQLAYSNLSPAWDVVLTWCFFAAGGTKVCFTGINKPHIRSRHTEHTLAQEWKRCVCGICVTRNISMSADAHTHSNNEWIMGLVFDDTVFNNQHVC